jgi:hypothetical protein
MNKYIEEILHKIARLLRARVIICIAGLWAVKATPSVAEWISIICGLALGVSGLEELRHGKSSNNDKGVVKRDSN